MRKSKEGKFYILCISAENYKILTSTSIKLKCSPFNSEQIRFNLLWKCKISMSLNVEVNNIDKCSRKL